MQRPVCFRSLALLKRDARKFFERQISLEERRKFDPVKQKEIKNYVVNDVLEKLEPHEKPPREREYIENAMGLGVSS